MLNYHTNPANRVNLVNPAHAFLYFANPGNRENLVNPAPNRENPAEEKTMICARITESRDIHFDQHDEWEAALQLWEFSQNYEDPDEPDESL